MDHQQSFLLQLTGSGFALLLASNAGSAGVRLPIDTELPASLATPAPASDAASENERPRAFGAFITLGAPQVAEVGGLYVKSPETRWNYFLEGGYLPLPLRANATFVGFDLEAGAQYHFLSTALYAGMSLGFQHLSYDTSVDFSSFGTDLGAQPASLRVENLYIEPSIGFLWRKKSGLLIGFDLGVGIPLLGWGRLDVSGGSSMATSVGSASQAPLGYFAGLVSPRIHLIRVGWMF